MRRFSLIAALAFASVVFAQQQPPAAAAAEAWAGAERRVLSGDIAEYTFTLKVGSGPYDTIGMHRIVRETAPGVPAHTARGVLLAHGGIWDFRAAFLGRAHPLPVFLAEHGVDVWGIDYRWTRVPAGADTSIMHHWGLAQDASDVGVALNIARHIRARTGSGFDRMFLLGWSLGGWVGYAYLNEESQLPPGQRNVKGYIPVEIYLKTNVPALKAAACQRQQNFAADLAAGNDANAVGGLLALIGTLAATDPNGASFLDPNLTNRQTGLLVGMATFVLQGGLEPVPFYHFTGGVFDQFGSPAGLTYSNEADLFALEQFASPYQPNRIYVDGEAATCEATDVPFDDHLADITVPVLYIGAGGGFGDYGLYTTTLLGSTDVNSLIVQKLAPELRVFDYGHADLFLANDAQHEVWEPLLDWLNAH
jgi:pimeloyl-ACP methyl ester carboxylesterase